MSSASKNRVIVRAVIDQGLTHAQAAQRFGVSRQWVHTLVRRYQLAGPDAVEPRSRAPHTTPGKIPPALTTRILQLRGELTTSGADAGPVTIAVRATGCPPPPRSAASCTPTD